MNCTPFFVFDELITRKNATLMLEKARKNNVRLRPHVKTHKTIEIADFQCDSSKAITVSTVAELLFYYKAGYKNQTYAVPITIEKLDYLNEKVCFETLQFLTDNLNLIPELQKWAAKNKQKLNLFIKIDSGAGRAGVQPKSSLLLNIASEITKSSNLQLVGLLTHAGQSYRSSDRDEKDNIAKKEVSAIVDSASFLESAGIEVKELSIGSTPTMMSDVPLEGITEIRPGNYIWYDVFQMNRGNCTENDIACYVVSSVIGIYPERQTIVIDAGALALSKDPGFWGDGKIKFGLVRGYPKMEIISLSQEHGIIKATAEICERFKVGDKLEILPNHSCLAAACFDTYTKVAANGVNAKIKPAKFWF